MKIPDKAFDQTVAIVGRTGSGKSYTARSQVEALLDRGERVCIIDPTGVWWGLKSSADGKRAGYEVAIFGGDHADIAIAEASAEPLAKIIATDHLSSIVDVSDMGISERTRFATHFFETLFKLNRRPLTLVLDEADVFAPQRPMPDQTVMFNRVEAIARRGRVKGFRPWLITQRPAELHKSVLSQANTLVAMEMTAPQDRDAMGAWIEGQGDRAKGKQVLAELASLPPGTGFLWAPRLGFLERIAFPRIKTFDSMRTPEHGETLTQPTKLAAVDLTGLVDALKPVALEPKTKGGHTKAEIDAAYARGREDGYDAGVLFARQKITEAIRLLALVTEQPAPLVAPAPPFVVGQITLPKSQPYVAVEPAKVGVLKPRPTEYAYVLTPTEQKIVDAIAWLHAADIEQPLRHQVAFGAGYTVNGHFNNVTGALKTKGVIDYPSAGRIALIDGVKRDVGVASRQGLIERVTAVLKGEAKRRIFRNVADARGMVPRGVLAEKSGYTENGHFNNLVGALKSLGVIDYPAKGFVSLSAMFEGIA